MVWKVEFSKGAERQFSKLDRAVQVRLADFIDNRLSLVEDPRSLGRALTGPKLSNFWRFRVGDYRLLCELHDDRLVIIVVELGHRSQVYR